MLGSLRNALPLPGRLCSDSGPPFSSKYFKDSVSDFHIKHVTSSPYHPRSNAVAERVGQEAKKLLTKCRYGTSEFFSALLGWRNSPRDERLKSPVQRLMGRQTRIQLPAPDHHLDTKVVPPHQVQPRLRKIRNKQRVYCNRTAKQLLALRPRDQMSVHDTLSRAWSPPVALGPASTPRSYEAQLEDGKVVRRTREHLRRSPASQSMEPSHRYATDSAFPSLPEQPQEPRRITRRRRS